MKKEKEKRKTKGKEIVPVHFPIPIKKDVYLNLKHLHPRKMKIQEDIPGEKLCQRGFPVISSASPIIENSVILQYSIPW